MKRLFVAIKINPDGGFIQAYRQLKSALRHEKIKWVEEHNIHITLKFFGETEEKKIPEIIRIMEETGRHYSVFRFSLKEIGIFGSKNDPRVIWTGIEPFGDLADLMEKLREAFRTIGFEPDRQNIVPHLTIGRIRYLKDKELFQQILDNNRKISSGGIDAGSMILYESILKKEGPVYIPLKTVSFTKPDL